MSHDIYSIGALRSLLRERCEVVGGVRAWSRAKKISAPYVSRVISGQRKPGEKILKALGLEESTVYVTKSSGR